ncbi:MAG TPA: methyltransferase domain-containing protein [Chloroflexota bacterium]|jgi:SAM-dependent methyltransferase|nr:methyltransferase domain-containing protein [Chloroflexota bacterium]
MADRVSVAPDKLTLSARRGRFAVRVDPSGIDDPALMVVVRGHQATGDPSRHFGSWRVRWPQGCGGLDVDLDFGAPTGELLRPRVAGQAVAVEEAAVNPAYVVEPVQNLVVTVVDAAGRPHGEATLLLYETDQSVLANYARHVHRVHGYTPRHEPARRFVLAFHGAKLRHLRRLFARHIPPGGLVADVGAGRSMFTELVEWGLWRAIPYRVVCSDVAVDVMAERAGAFPELGWLGASAVDLPFRSARFDALFAGEILEHVVDPAAAVREWVRLVRPGGTLVITTPNRKRITNLVNHADTPMGPDHVSELTYDEAMALFRSQGLEVLETCGVYLELDLQWRSPGPKVDLAPRREHFPGRELVLKALNWLGRPFPRLALDVIYVLRTPRR